MTERTETLTLPVFIRDPAAVAADPALAEVYIREVRRNFAKALSPFITYSDETGENGTVRTFKLRVVGSSE